MELFQNLGFHHLLVLATWYNDSNKFPKCNALKTPDFAKILLENCNNKDHILVIKLRFDRSDCRKRGFWRNWFSKFPGRIMPPDPPSLLAPSALGCTYFFPSHLLLMVSLLLNWNILRTLGMHVSGRCELMNYGMHVTSMQIRWLHSRQRHGISLKLSYFWEGSVALWFRALTRNPEVPSSIPLLAGCAGINCLPINLPASQGS